MYGHCKLTQHGITWLLMIRLILMIAIVSLCGVGAQEHPALSENKWEISLGSQWLELGGSLALSETQSLFASVGWIEFDLKDVTLLPVPLVSLAGFDWVVAEKWHYKSNSFSIGYRWFRQSQLETGRRFLSIPLEDRFNEKYWVFLIKTQTISSEVDLRFFDAINLEGIANKKTFVTPAFGVTHVYRDYQDGNVGNIKYTTNVLVGLNINTEGKKMYPIPQFSVLYSIGVFI